MAEIYRFLDSSEAAAFLKVSLHTIYKWVSRSSIPHRKHGNKLVFLQNELLDWSNQRLVAARQSFQRPQAYMDNEVQVAIKRAQCSLKIESVVENTQLPSKRR